MLFKRWVLEGIAAGAISLAFRRWRQPRVRAGSRLRTAVGVLAVKSIDLVNEADISEAEARRAGHASREALLAELNAHTELGDGPVYRIALRIAGPDLREALRRRDDLSEEEVADLAKRLMRLDKASRHGPWTLQALRLIGERPGVRAADLASSLGRDTRSFKTDVRKLKELGLTESLETGYRLSPRGRAVVERLGE